GQLLRGPGLPEQLERAVLGERPDALGVHVLADQPFEDGVDRRAELERIAGLGLALLDVVQLAAERALLEAREPRVRQVLGDGRGRRHASASLSGFGFFSKATTCEPGNASSTRQMVAACSGVISWRPVPVYSGTSQTSPNASERMQ